MDQEHRALKDAPATPRPATLANPPRVPTVATVPTVLATLAMTALLSGCPAPATRPDLPNAPSDAPQPDLSASPVTPSPASPAPRPPRENHLSPATRSLVAQAHTLVSKGDFDGASSTLDRALRIEPNNPLLWIERGRLRLAENDPRQAESCGRKALALASGDRSTQAQAGKLLADALRAQNRNPEAHAVESQPYMH
jgi:tetratricopeptide (TPR) repeat protein